VTVSGGVKCAISNELLDSGSDVDHDVDSQIFTGIFYHGGTGTTVRIFQDQLP